VKVAITIDLPAGSSPGGTVRNSVPPQENPGTFENKVTVRARTRHGDITIYRAETPR
jgi:hypothetical protein